MNILMLGNNASVPMVWAKYLNEEGIKTEVVHSGSGFDQPLGLTLRYHHLPALPVEKFIHYLVPILKHVDIIQYNNPEYIIGMPLLKTKYPEKKHIITYMGDFVNLPTFWTDTASYNGSADKVTVVRKGLLKHAHKGVELTPITVDMDHCERVNDYINDSALYIRYDYVGCQVRADVQVAKLKSKNPHLNIRKQSRNGMVFPYNCYMRFLELFEYLIDYQVERDEVTLKTDLNTTCLQQLALGGKVFLPDRKVCTFPKENKPENVTKKWIKIFDKVMK